jgi:hypothetical protein
VNTQKAGWLIWITRAVTVLALPGPLPSIFGQLTQGRVHIPQPSPGSILETSLRVLFGIYALYWFLLWVSGKIVCAVLATLTISVALRRGVDPRTRALTVAAGSITCCLLLWWVNFVKHQW